MPDRIASYRAVVERHMAMTLAGTSLPYGEHKTGKVRDRYRLDERHLLFVTTDRLSAFDRVLAAVPFKGQVLNQTSAWWFDATSPIIPNHMVATIHPNACIVQDCRPFPVEFVVRAYVTGSTDTSLWTHYQRGERLYCGNRLKDGMRKNQKLDVPILTPTTKEEAHDRPIDEQTIVGDGLMSASQWKTASEAALQLFAYGTAQARKRGLILVDTKYEFGVAHDGSIMLIDEVHTPDSSRFWLADSYRQRFAAGEEPQSIDKEFIRLWFKQVCDPYKDKVLPAAPPAMIVELALRYIEAYERITAKPFVFPDAAIRERDIEGEIQTAVNSWLRKEART
jgi:phosphoribosylaminoimidazole-succinocarboxamide synthase